MSTGSSSLYTFEEYKNICILFGMVREWEFEMSYKIYLKYASGIPEEMDKAVLMSYYNDMYFKEGSLN